MSIDLGFADLGLDSRIVSVLTGLGYEEPTQVQAKAIPEVINGRDLIAQAATGTGKTAAFSLPLVQKIITLGKRRPTPSTLVLVPTRELAMQVAEAMHGYGHSLSVRVVPIYGGQSYDPQIRALQRGVDVVIATPGRAIDHIRRGTLDLTGVKHVVLDEADEMLDMGFVEDIETILAETNDERQVLLFSATMPPRVATIAKRYMKDPVHIKIAQEQTAPGELPRIRQTGYVVGRSQKRVALGRILDVENPKAAIIFCRTRHEVDELADTLNAHGRGAEPLHGGMSQVQRERIVKKLRDGKTSLVIATDVAARGLDIEQLTHVINFDVPSAPEAYVHRIGRVGRAGRDGVAITLVEPRETRYMRNIEHATKQRIEAAKVPSAADLKAMRLNKTAQTLREALQGDGLEAFQSVVDGLLEEHDLMAIALGAIKVAHLAMAPGPEDTVEIFDGGGRKGARAPRESKARAIGPTVRLHLNAGRSAHLRPNDIVGAITAEAGIEGRQIGAIDLAERFTIVEVDATVEDVVLDALRKTTIKGRAVQARRWVEKDGVGSKAQAALS